MRIFKKLFKKKDGVISIMMVTAIFAGAIMVAGLTDIIIRAHIMNETGAIMDVAGVTALRSGVDEQRLRAEEFEVDKSMVSRNYRSLVDQELTKYGHLHNHKHVRTKVESFEESWGLGTSNKVRHQTLLDSTVRVTVNSNVMFDTIPLLAKRFYDARSNGDFEVEYQGKSEDGKIELIIRSVSRVVYR